MVSAYLVSTYGFDGKHRVVSVDVADRKISDQRVKSVFVSDRHLNIRELRNLKELTET